MAIFSCHLSILFCVQDFDLVSWRALCGKWRIRARFEINCSTPETRVVLSCSVLNASHVVITVNFMQSAFVMRAYM